MKQFHPLLLILPAVFLIVFHTGCVKDRCGGIVCLNEGLCVDGQCTCPLGYDGPVCETRWSDQFTGTWQNEEKTADSANNISFRESVIFIREAPLASVFLVDSLEGSDSIVCEISGRHSFRFRAQYSRDSSFFIEEGQGVLDTLTGVITAGYTFHLHNSRRTSEMKWRALP